MGALTPNRRCAHSPESLERGYELIPGAMAQRTDHSGAGSPLFGRRAADAFAVGPRPMGSRPKMILFEASRTWGGPVGLMVLRSLT